MTAKKIRKIFYIMYVMLWSLLVLMIPWTVFIVLARFFIVGVIKGFIWWNNLLYAALKRLYNTHTFGFKRRGKDLSTQLEIIKRFKRKYNKTKKELLHIIKKFNIDISIDELEKFHYYYKPNYLSNVDYGYGGRIIELKELELVDNRTGKFLTYEDIIDGSFKTMQFTKIQEFEGVDLKLSDVQVGLPNTEGNKLDKFYPWLGPFIALCGQLYNMIVEINSQEFDRPWIKIRNQQDYYIQALKTFPVNKGIIQKFAPYLPYLNKWLFIRIRIYEKRQAAEAGMIEWRAPGLINEGAKAVYLTSGQATKEEYESTNGKIKKRWLAVKIKDLKYDSRIYHEYVFNEKAPKIRR